jgi:hypothetical protein
MTILVPLDQCPEDVLRLLARRESRITVYEIVQAIDHAATRDQVRSALSLLALHGLVERTEGPDVRHYGWSATDAGRDAATPRAKREPEEGR